MAGAVSLNHFVGAASTWGMNFKAERLSNLEVDHKPTQLTGAAGRIYSWNSNNPPALKFMPFI
jgi:hypothetical protein